MRLYTGQAQFIWIGGIHLSPSEPQSADAGPGEVPAPAASEPPQQVQIDLDQLAKAFGVQNPGPVIDPIATRRGSQVITLVVNEEAQSPALLAPAMLGPLEAVLKAVGPVERIDLFLRTLGGVTEVPWRIVSMLREFCDELGVIVSGMALSGGAHICMGADDLIMGPFATIGSVDPTRRHPMLPKDGNGQPTPTSVQDLKHCIEFIQEQVGENSDPASLATIVSELFHYVNPLALGALEQSYKLSRLITKKVLATRATQLKDDHIEKIVDTLAGKYFSHSFPISRRDIQDDLGLPVVAPDPAFTAEIEALQKHYQTEFQKSVNVGGTPVQARIVAFLGSATEQWANLRLTKGDEAVLDRWIRLP